MSWSVAAIGKPAAVKAAINQQFASCLPQLAQNEALRHEHASAALAQESIEAQLNFLIDNGISTAVKVEAGGHAWVTKPYGETGTRLTVETVPNFVE